MTSIRAAAVQLSPVLYSREGTVEKVVAKIDELAYQEVQFATFPETVVPYYPYFSFVQRPYAMSAEHMRLLAQAVTVPSPATEAIRDAARRAGMVVSIGVNERDGGSLFNTQLLFDADGTLIQRRRKITPTFHERMVWGQGDGSGLRAVESAVGRVGQLACWEHYNPLARYSLIADGEQIHSAMFPGSIFGDLFSQQSEIQVRNHALESGAFVVAATAWLDPDQQAQIMADTGSPAGPLSGGCFTAIVTPQGELLGEPLRSGEGAVIADLDFAQIDRRKAFMDSSGHYSRPELLSLLIDRTPRAQVHETRSPGSPVTPAVEEVEMSSADSREIRFEGVRLRFDSDRSYDELLAALLADVGEKPVAIDELPSATFQDWESFATEVARHLGPSDFMLLELIDHGGWIKTAGIDRKAMRVIIGNPLIAITMLRHDLTAGLFAPVELLLLEEGDGRSSLTYVKPSSLMVVDENPPLSAAAQVLDDKLAALAGKVTASSTPAQSGY